MTVEIKVGGLADFFESARDTAREIDQGSSVSPKSRIWVEPADVQEILKPSRIQLVHYLRGKKQVTLKDLVSALHRTAVTLNRDLDLLARYQLVRTYSERNPGHGVRKVVEPTFGANSIEIMARI